MAIDPINTARSVDMLCAISVNDVRFCHDDTDTVTAFHSGDGSIKKSCEIVEKVVVGIERLSAAFSTTKAGPSCSCSYRAY